MKILAICQAGTVRSGALVIEAKLRGHDALQAGIAFNPPPTLTMLANWADVILLAEPHMIGYVPTEHAGKCVDTGLGPDRWGNPLNPELRALASGVIGKL